MKASGKMTKLKDKAFTLMEMGQNMKACGKVINSMDLGRRYGQMVLNMKAIMYRERSMELGNLGGRMDLFMKGTFSTIISMGKVRISGATVDSMRVSGEKIECIIEGFSNGQMVENTLVSMSMIKKKGTEFLDGLEEEVTEVTGEKENSMGMEFTLEMEQSEKVNGKMGQELDGSMKNKLKIFSFQCLKSIIKMQKLENSERDRFFL